MSDYRPNDLLDDAFGMTPVRWACERAADAARPAPPPYAFLDLGQPPRQSLQDAPGRAQQPSDGPEATPDGEDLLYLYRKQAWYHRCCACGRFARLGVRVQHKQFCPYHGTF